MNNRPKLIFDTEVYKNYWLIKFYDFSQSGVMCAKLELFPNTTLDRETLYFYLSTYEIISFNGNHYDEPMLTYAMQGATCAQLKIASDLIIQGGLKPWEFYDHFQLQRLPYLDHVDLKEVAIGVNVSLKTYGGRLGSKRLQDLPVEPDAWLTPEQIRLIDHPYCTNDLLTTYDLYKTCLAALDLRVSMSEEYGVDLRSKSDAQIAESIIKVKLGFKPERVTWAHGTPFKYVPPPFVSFPANDVYMSGLLDTIRNAIFRTSDLDQVETFTKARARKLTKGDFAPKELTITLRKTKYVAHSAEAMHEILKYAGGVFDDLNDDDDAIEDVKGEKVKTGIIMPPEIKALRITINKTTYKLGIGGLHSTEHAVNYQSDDTQTLNDDDVASYYPSLILICGMYPKQLGQGFLTIYREIYEGRLSAKNLAGEIKKQIKLAEKLGHSLTDLQKQLVTAQVESDAKKIVLNGTFGKLGSKYSIMFAPDLLLAVTLTGQLALLMLIRMLENNGVRVVSANTDGIVTLCPKGYEFMKQSIIDYWQGATGLQMENTTYKALFSRDVNNYIAIKNDGDHKGKGIFTKTGIAKNPKNMICVSAVVEYLKSGTPLEKTIMDCTDIKQFLTVRNVKGGAVFQSYKPLPPHGTKEQLLRGCGYIEVINGRLKRWTNRTDLQGQTLGVAYNALCEQLQRGENSPVLGKVVRYYLGRGELGQLAYASNGNKVPDSQGARALMELPDTFPLDVDYQAYVQIARDMLKDVGIVC